jgi:hypothetical protein
MKHPFLPLRTACAAPLLALATFAAFGTVATPSAMAAMAASSYDLAAQLDLLLQWWPGEYDNHEQIVRQSGGGLSPLTSTPFFRVHSVVTRVELPSLGAHVLQLVEYRDDDPARELRRRLLVLSADEKSGALRAVQYTATTPAAAQAQAPGAIAPAPAIAGCDLSLQFVGGQFEGGTASTSCVGGDRKAPPFRVVIGPRYAWTSGEGAPAPADGWFEQIRARRFTCTVHEAANGEMRDTRYLTTVHLHDQGGEADIAWPDGRTLTFTIHNRAFTMPPDREYPLFRIHEKGKTVPIAYAYAIDDAKRFGLNLGWFYIRCYVEGDWSAAEGDQHR